MNFFKISIAIIFTLILSKTYAQDDFFKELDSVPSAKINIETSAFKGLQVCTMQSTKMASKGEWYMLVAHRFGDLSKGFDNFFGFDNAHTKLGGLYGISNWLTVGFSRHTLNKIYEVSAKYKLANQEVNGFPVTIVGYNTVDINTKLGTNEFPGLQSKDRFAFSTQLPISRKFSKNFSMEVNPIYVHKNLYDAMTEKADNFLMGIGLRHKLSKRMSLNIESVIPLNANKSNFYTNASTIGLDIETGGHIFQLLFSNSQALNDITYFTNANGTPENKAIYFGFNLYRVF